MDCFRLGLSEEVQGPCCCSRMIMVRIIRIETPPGPLHISAHTHTCTHAHTHTHIHTYTHTHTYIYTYTYTYTLHARLAKFCVFTGNKTSEPVHVICGVFSPGQKKRAKEKLSN